MKKNFGKKLFSLFFAVLMVVSVIPLGTITASAAVSHSQSEAVEWAKQRVKNPIDYDGVYGVQCVDLIKAYYNYLGNTPVRGNANEYAWNALPSGWTRIQYYDGFVPQPGDIAVWTYARSAYGHVAIVLTADQSRMYVAEQNGSSHTGREHSYSYSYGTFYGVIRPDFANPQPSEGFGGSAANDTHYDASVTKQTGTYINTCNSGVNMRSSAGVQAGNKIGCTVPKNAEVYVYETNGNWGKITFANRVGWVCLDYFTKVSIPVPATPSISAVSADNIAVGKTVTINWNAVSGADSYTVGIRSDHVNQDITVGNTTSYSFKLDYAETYQFYVKASNVSGTSNWSSPRSSTAHDPVTVTFVDWDDTVLHTQTVDYGASATAPSAPVRKGYTFQEWDDSYYNVTSDKTIKATYKIETYTVNFFDKDGTLLSSQKVTYGSDATPPSDTHETGTYKFMGWNSTAYMDVYTDRADKNINIDGIYSWYNYDLPTVCTITSATRQFDGYYVTFNIENNDSTPTTGRAVVALKTAEGKLVDMTESTAFSIPAAGKKNGVEVFIPCNKVASSIEVFMVADYASGIPISPSVTSEIEEGLMYAESTVKPDNSDGTLDIQEVTQYRYRDKEFSTGNTMTKDGWEYTGNRTEIVGNWTGWDWTVVTPFENESQRRETEQRTAVVSQTYKTQYNYTRYSNSSGSRFGPCAGTWSGSWCGNYQEWGWHDYGLPYVKTTWSNQYGGNYNLYNSTNDPWYNEMTRSVVASTNYGTQYRYRDINYVYHFYRWGVWSDWSDTQVTANDNRDVQTRTIYRYKSNNIQPEDTSGEVRTVSGTVDSAFAGKQITLYVYGYTGASDYTNQYIGQSIVGEDGSYSFTFKLREEPTVETGDYTVAIGIEGTTNTTVIDTIEAPVPTYEVNFYDWDGTIISTQTVKEGEDAVLPANPEKEGYDFLGWDKSVSNIREDTDFFADFEKKEFTVIFVDWYNQQIAVKTFAYGDSLIAPEVETIEGYTFTGWDCEDTIVTQNMIVSAQYEANTYTVTFYDWNNKVVDKQTVKYGETAVVPDDPEEEGVIFADWFNPEDYQYVEHDAAIYPTYWFEETTDVVTANYYTGEYDSALQLELTTSDENATIFYYFNGDETTEQLYTAPITIDKSCSVTYYATSLGKNDSEISTNYYCINTGDAPSDWMLYDELPEDVRQNLSDYTLESETGYKYKDVQQTSSPEEAQSLAADGWTLGEVSYTPYTDWQDEEIAVDSSLMGFEVDTQQTADPSVTWYQYSHYKYTDSDGVVQYSPTAVEDYACEEEAITLENRLTIAGFTDDSISYYNYNGQVWYNQTRVSGLKTQYRSRYQVAEYYRWTDWGIEAPSSDDDREYQTDDVYRYANKNYHLVYINIYGEVLLVEEGKAIDTTQLDNIEGYDFVGLYYDEALAEPFDLSTEITESITLFTKYAPKKYTVTFLMQDGTELDVQTVEYLSSATAPETDVVPGYIFGGWDKDFSCITEDTVVTGTYYKESEYARIALDRTSVELYQGSFTVLIPTITPSELSNEAVEWSSSDPEIVSVDEFGTITALTPGTATITVTVTKTGEAASCTVTVTPDKSNFILLKSDSSLNYDDLGYLRRVGFNTTAGELSEEFANTNLRFFGINGKELGATDVVGTGTTVRLYNGDSIADEKTLVVTGDMTGDGIINNRDVAMMNRFLLGTTTAQEFQQLAIDVNGDGYIDNRDAAMVARYLVGKDTF